MFWTSKYYPSKVHFLYHFYLFLRILATAFSCLSCWAITFRVLLLSKIYNKLFPVSSYREFLTPIFIFRNPVLKSGLAYILSEQLFYPSVSFSSKHIPLISTHEIPVVCSPTEYPAKSGWEDKETCIYTAVSLHFQ